MDVGREGYHSCDDDISSNVHSLEEVEDFVPKAVLSFNRHMNITGWEDNNERLVATIPSPINIEGGHLYKCFGFVFLDTAEYLLKAVIL